MGRSVISDPNHVKGKKKKNITHLPSGTPLTPEMQKMLGPKDPLEITDLYQFGVLLDIFIGLEDKGKGPMYRDDGRVELYFIPTSSPNTFVYEEEANRIWYTKDSNPKELIELYKND